MKLFKEQIKNNKGFTLVETLIAISIFTMSVLALLVVLSQGISHTNYAKQKIIASYLAQEGVEYMRNMRDTFVLFDVTSAQTGWDAFNAKLANANCDGVDGCYFDDRNTDYTNNLQQTYKNNLLIIACGDDCPSLLYEEITGKYGYVSGINSGFIRKISVTQIANQTKISSTVYWTQGSGIRSISFSESLFNWIE